MIKQHHAQRKNNQSVNKRKRKNSGKVLGEHVFRIFLSYLATNGEDHVNKFVFFLLLLLVGCCCFCCCVLLDAESLITTRFIMYIICSWKRAWILTTNSNITSTKAAATEAEALYPKKKEKTKTNPPVQALSSSPSPSPSSPFMAPHSLSTALLLFHFPYTVFVTLVRPLSCIVSILIVWVNEAI